MLLRQCFDVLDIGYTSEPVFSGVSPAAWYQDFATKHGLKLRIDQTYNPDFLLQDGTWVEGTLSENTAFKKVMRHGHQTSQLRVVWLDPDDGLYKQICKDVTFPNAEVCSVSWYYSRLDRTTNGREIVNKLELLKVLKHQVP